MKYLGDEISDTIKIEININLRNQVFNKDYIHDILTNPIYDQIDPVHKTSQFLPLI